MSTLSLIISLTDVYIVNGEAAEFSEVNQNEENVLFSFKIDL